MKLMRSCLVIAAFIMMFAPAAAPGAGEEVFSGEEKPSCAKCHSDAKTGAPMKELPPGSAHSGLSCRECHPGEDMPPCPPESRPASCKTCHSDQVKALARSTHGKNMAEYLKSRKRAISLADLCYACHGSDAHHLRPGDDPSSPVNHRNVFDTCLSCHREIQPIAIEVYKDSIHARAVMEGEARSAVCSDCHGSAHAIEGMENPDSPVYFKNVPDTCGRCHVSESAEYKESKHWKTLKEGFREAPVCTDCHGEHGIQSRRDPRSPVWAGNVTKTCSRCHESERLNAKFMLPRGMVKSFQKSYHGLYGSLGDVRAANCSSCHGNHSILPRSDPRSPVNPENLGKTCGGCHPGAEKLFTSELIHKAPKKESHRLVALVRGIYIFVIITVVGAMFFHNLADLVCKSVKGVFVHREEELFPRMSVNERIQHGILAVSFIALAYSGFALAFPDSLVALPFQWMSSGALVRRWMHRIAALVFVLLSLYHLGYLAFSRRGRVQSRLLVPRVRDLKDFFRIARNCLRKSPERIKLPHYSYVEKAEYWALVWGGLVMSLTGLVLLLTDYVLGFAPLWVIDLADTIHYFEAILAVAAIIVWHGYWVIFDPEYYPMNLTWLLGNPRRSSSFRGEAEKTEVSGEEPSSEP